MSYVFDVSQEHNNLCEVHTYLLCGKDGDYHKCNRTDEKGHLIYSVIYWDKRYALQFKLKFNAKVIEWDESDNQEIVSIEDLLERGYVEMKLKIPYERSLEFHKWCEDRDFAVVDELKFISEDMEPFTVYVPADQQVLVKLTWG